MILNDICLNITDGKHGDCEPADNSGYYFISSKDIQNGVIRYDYSRQITKNDYVDANKRTNMEDNDILITNSGTIGRMCYVDENAKIGRTTFQKSVALIKPDTEKVNPRFLYYYLNRHVDKLIRRASGTSQKNLLLVDLRNFKINIPGMEYQNEVVSKLKIYDDRLKTNRELIATLEQYSRLLFHKWFNDSDMPSVVGEHKDWPLTALDYCYQVTDGTHATPKPVDEGYYLVTSKHIKNGLLNTNDAYFISEQDYNEVNKRSKVEQWDILFSMIGSVGEVYLEVNSSPQYAIKNLGLFKMNGDKNKALKLYYYLTSPFFQKMLRFWLSGSIQSFVPLYFLRGIKLPEKFNSNDSISAKVFDEISVIFEKIAQLREENSLLEESHRLLIKKLIT